MEYGNQAKTSDGMDTMGEIAALMEIGHSIHNRLRDANVRLMKTKTRIFGDYPQLATDGDKPAPANGEIEIFRELLGFALGEINALEDLVESFDRI